MLRSLSSAVSCAVFAALISSSAFAQAPAPVAAGSARPSFEVATIKLTDPNFGGILVGFPSGRFSARGFTLKDLIGFAYDVDNRQIVEGPKWADTERYDVLGKPEKEGTPNPDLAKLMLQSLLAERYQLRFHHDTREMPVYVMTIAKNGIKMKARTDGDGGEKATMLIRGAKIPGRDTTVQFLATGLQKLVLDRPILDKTGLTGKYDFDLTWRPDPSQFRGNGDRVPSDPNDPDLFTALQQQLGLRLTAQKAPADVIVIDAAEKPSEN